ncbi:hypothetical protein CAEBREN_22387 [Caenorhabditis brenneri]|uniref:CHK kinase-like domain-containing protein n=1 Tax=Caenorhabditis brenneri TaxID=135651 RepID=G0M9G4_CAEBE|nr:hypothetical protein CAEBREN_22387 [Caenorhabditis brenneri]
MSLYKTADGILETHVTWEDVELELQKRFFTEASFGEKKTARNISDQKGYMSKIALVNPDWQNIEPGKALPIQFAVKISSQLPFMAFSKVLKYTDENGYEDEKLKFMGKILREAHNREVEAYKLLEKFNHKDVPYTKVYATKPFLNESDLKGYIIMDFIPDVFTTSMSEPIPADDLIHTIRGVATFAALGHSLPDDDKKFALGAEFLEYYFNTFLEPASIESTLVNLKGAFLSFCEVSRVENLIEIYRQYIKIVSRFTRISELLGFKMIFNHGDLWQSNMLYKRGYDGKLKLKAIIDWQALSLLPPGFDMARLFIGSLSVEDRRQRASELLKVFHETFTNTLGEELFQFQEIRDSYYLHFPLMSLMVLPGMIPFLENHYLQKTVMKKMEAIMVDVMEVHDAEYCDRYIPQLFFGTTKTYVLRNGHATLNISGDADKYFTPTSSFGRQGIIASGDYGTMSALQDVSVDIGGLSNKSSVFRYYIQSADLVPGVELEIQRTQDGNRYTTRYDSSNLPYFNLIIGIMTLTIFGFFVLH